MGKASRTKQRSRHSGGGTKHSGSFPRQARNFNEFLSRGQPGTYTLSAKDMEVLVTNAMILAMRNDDLAAFTQSVDLAAFMGINILDLTFSFKDANGNMSIETLFGAAFYSGAVEVLIWLGEGYVNKQKTQDARVAFLGFSVWLMGNIETLDKASKMFSVVSSIVEYGIRTYGQKGFLDQVLELVDGPLGPIVSAMVSQEKARTKANAEKKTFEAEIPIPPAQPDQTGHGTLRV